MAWDPKAAKAILRATATSWRRDAKLIADNLADYASSEEEFVLGLLQGVGLDADEVFNFAAEISGEPVAEVAARYPGF